MKFFGLNHNQSNGSYAFVTLSNGFLYNLVTFEVKVAVSNELGRLCDVLGPKTKVVELDELNNFA